MQHAIVKPTTDSIQVQRDAIHEKIARIIEAAAASNVNILCLQEVWSELNDLMGEMAFMRCSQ